MDEDLSRSMGSVTLQVGALEFFTRYSLNQNRTTSVLSSLHEFRTQENEQTGGKQWNWTYLRNQFDQKDLEGLYRKYDDKLRETLIYIYISLLVTFSTVHIILVVLGTHSEETQSQSTFVFMGMYVLRITIPIISAWKCYYDKRKKKCFWMPMLVSFIITVDLVLTDIAVPIYSFHEEGIPLRPAYATMALLSVYIFLPMRNNFMSIILGALVSVVYVLIFAFFTYSKDPQIGVVVTSDIIYMIGVNLMGIYFRLMNEIVTRRSFLDRRACVESTLRLIFVKDQEERLMLSILPEHIVSRVRQDIRAIYLRLQSHDLIHNVKSFNERYVEEHDNVSILSADVVNYTKISTTLSPLRMVEFLNELFGRFDEASEEHDVLRIKFLGDCYYCVSGIEKPTPQHAKNCVDLGLEMIHIIKDVREKRALNIDMRIGVHSGRILSGLVGIRKWQFDVWSKDVTIATKMESTGQAGKVHVTKQTLELLVNFAREYIIEPNFASQSDEFITKNKLETFLISRPMRSQEYRPFRRPSVGLNKIITKSSSSSRRAENRNSQMRRTTTFMDEHLVEFQLTLRAADAQMAKEIDDMTNGREQFKKESSLNGFTMMFKNFNMEKTFLMLPDPLFKYYITCCLIILILLLLINGLTTNWLQGFQWYTWTLFSLLIFILIAMQPLTWFHFMWTTYKGVEEPRNSFLRYIYDTSVNIIRSAKVRTGMYLIISLGLAATSIVNVSGCTEVEVDPVSETVQSNCVSSWHVTQCWGLALLLNFLFSRVFFILKWIVAGVMTLFYLWVVWDIKTELFFSDMTWNVGLDPRLSHSLSIIFITVTLYWIDRTTEYRNKLDYVWQVQLSDEQQEAETMLKVNNMLLENILPAHVVQVYLNLHRPLDELYYEKYDNVAVMFASLTDYKLSEDDSDLSDKTVLSMLDSIISDFDRLLMTGSSTYKVEKIKMAGWTYMAACGLDPSRRNSFDTSSNHSTVEQNTAYNRALVITMVEFATTMMMKLQDFNHSSFQSFEGLSLRIGISNGEVAAGVVGSTKPLYDIWGHAVNMASRMDSTGERGKIQVTENTAIILDECGILTTYRGETFVKGAGYIKTYFVPFDENFNLIKKERSKDYYRHEFRNYYDVRSSIDEDISSVDSFETESQYSVRGTSSRDFTKDMDFDISRTATPSDIDVSDTLKSDSNNSDVNSVTSERGEGIKTHL